MGSAWRADKVPRARSAMRSSGWPAATAWGVTSGRAWCPTPLNLAVRSDGAVPDPGDRAFVAAGEQRVPSRRGGRPHGIADIIAVHPGTAIGGEEPESVPVAGDTAGLPAGAGLGSGRGRAVSPAVRRRPRPEVRVRLSFGRDVSDIRSRRRGVRRAGAGPRQPSRSRCRRLSRKGDARQYAGHNGTSCTAAREPF